MLRRLRFECAACSASFVDWLDDDDELTSAFCVNCGQRVAHAVPYGPAPYGTRASEATSALGLVRGSGHEFPETLRGLRPPRAPSFLTSEVAPPRPQLAPASDRPFARADSTAPRPASEPVAGQSAAPARFWQRPRFAQLGALFIGFALGVPLTCLVEHAYFRARRPAAPPSGLDLTRQLAQVSAALDDGNLAGARSLLEQSARLASVGDRRLSVLRARLAFESADAEWIRRQAQSKLGAALDAARQAFADLAFQALETTKQERAAAPRDPALWVLAVDGLRLYGDHERAAWLARGLPTSDAEANYALGTLGMATQEHTPSAFLPFLRAAAESSNARARARAGLTLGLILSHHAEEAERELLAVQSLARPHPALAELRRLYDAEFAARPATLAAARQSSVSTSAPPVVKVEASPQAQLARARELQRLSRLTEAEHLYESILRARPNDSEARTGLAEVELLRGSVPEAQALYERALSTNENYVPAWVALADIDWQRGQLERAVCRYQLVVSRFPEGTYPPYINQRILRVMGSGAVPPTARTDLPAASACGD